MIAELQTPHPATARTGIVGIRLPGHGRTGGTAKLPHQRPLPYPAIEELPSFVTRIDSSKLQPGARHYNGSIARLGGRIFMAYRFESYHAVSYVGICEMDEDWNVLRDELLQPTMRRPDTHFEDPHMATVDGKLVCLVSDVVRDFPATCQQRILLLDPETLGIEREVPCGLGNVNGFEKNWTPFELPEGGLGVVYKQVPRTVARVADLAGFTAPAVPMVPNLPKSTISGRTGPLRVSKGLYLEFVGGHVQLLGNDPQKARGTRYWVGALCFEAKEPYTVVGWTPEPIVWGSEASPTIHNPLAEGGHPICVIPFGAMLDGNEVLVSCGVNDSYIAILRFGIEELIGKMAGNAKSLYSAETFP